MRRTRLPAAADGAARGVTALQKRRFRSGPRQARVNPRPGAPCINATLAFARTAVTIRVRPSCEGRLVPSSPPPAQQALPLPFRGGRRRGAGRRPSGERAGLPHVAREVIRKGEPVHVTHAGGRPRVEPPERTVLPDNPRGNHGCSQRRRLPGHPLQRPGQPPPPHRRGGRRRFARERHARALHPPRARAQPDDGAEGAGARGPLPRARPPDARRGPQRPPLRPRQLREPRGAPGRASLYQGLGGPVLVRGGESTARGAAELVPGASDVRRGGLAAPPRCTRRLAIARRGRVPASGR